MPITIENKTITITTGLDYEFYGSTTLEGLGDSGSALDVGPMDEGREDWGAWGLRFTGLLMPPADGEYAFRAEADTGLCLYINGKQLWTWGKPGAGRAELGHDVACQIKTHDVTLTLASNSGNLAKTGYTFAGWNTAADGSGTSYAPGASYTSNAAVTLYAKWAAVLVWWKFDETSGTTAADSSGNNNEGTLTNMGGTEWTAGKLNNCLSFDGVNDYVVRSALSSNITGDCTVSVRWSSPTATPPIRCRPTRAWRQPRISAAATISRANWTMCACTAGRSRARRSSRLFP